MTGENLIKEVSMEETAKALRGIWSYKAPGPDGFQVIFFKRTWHIVGEAVHTLLRELWKKGRSWRKLLKQQWY